jgi:hypothetical protein
MRLESAQGLKQQFLVEIVEPLATRGAALVTEQERARVAAPGTSGRTPLFNVSAKPLDAVNPVQRTLALGVAPYGRDYRLAVRLQRAALRDSPLVEQLTKRARGEVDIRMVGRIDKRTPGTLAARGRRQLALYLRNARPLLIGASVGHVKVTAGTLGAFVERRGAVCLLSNNHVLANEDAAALRDWILQRAHLDGGRSPRERVARLAGAVRLKRRGTNRVDAAVAELEEGLDYDPRLLKDLVRGADRKLKGLGPEFLDAGATVYKIGRTTGPTKGRVTAFDLDNVVVSYDLGNLRFDGQVEIEGAGRRAFSDGGDSGSLIVDSAMRAVALLFAGSDTGGRNGAGLTYANPIHRVLKDLKAKLLS